MGNLVEIDISKAYSGAFMRIKAVPVFNEFDAWQPYEGQAIRKLSLYLVEATEFDLFFNKQFTLVYGCFLKQLPTLPTIRAVKHPSVVKKVDYARLVTELFGAPESAMTTRRTSPSRRPSQTAAMACWRSS